MLHAFLTPQKVLQARHQISEQYVSEAVEQYMVALTGATRRLEQWDESLAGVLEIGASPRATLSLLHAASAKAWLEERDFVTPDDVIAMLPDILRHRIRVSFAGRAQQWTEDSVIEKIIEMVPVPVLDADAQAV